MQPDPNTANLMFTIIGGLVYPFLFIWATNTLFKAGIPFSFKTWLATIFLFLTLRFFVNKSHYSMPEFDDDNAGYDDDGDEEEEEEEPDDPPPPPYRPKRGRMRRVK